MFHPEPRKRLLILAFDGVIHSAASGWVQHNIIPDPPVPGAFEFIEAALEHFNVAVFSSRSSRTMGIEAMRQWFRHNECPQHVIDALQFPLEKLPAFITIDDRAITFTGKWPAISDLLRFRTWMEANPPALTAASRMHLINAIAQLRSVQGDEIEARYVLQQWVLNQLL